MKILLVEDTRTMAALMAARLSAFGHEVTIAADGKIAVEKFTELEPDLILMDIEMPVMNGFEATNRIRALEAQQAWAWTPIIFLTASDSESNLITAIEAGGDDFMSKSISEPILHAKMKAMSRIAGLRQRLSTANQKLADLASRDGLTGLLNRRTMDMHLDENWERALRQQKPFGLLMLDVDNFKKYNDHYGHQAGDDCLRAVASALQNATDAFNHDHPGLKAFAARYGGEEFAIIIPDAPQEAYAALAKSVLEAIRSHGIEHVNNANWNIVTASIGGCHVDSANSSPSSSPKHLFRDADTRLYQAKEQGRNCAVL